MSQPQISSRNTAPPGQTPPGTETAKRKQYKVIGLAAAGIVVIAVGAYLFWPPKKPPRLNARVEELVRYVEDAGFQKLPFDTQFTYLKAIETHTADLAKAHKAKKLSDEQYTAAKEYAWFGKQITHMERYASLRTSAERQKYADKLIDSKLKKSRKAAAKGGAAPAGAGDEAALKRDTSFEKVLPLTWPAEKRSEWEQFRKALRDREKQLVLEGRKEMLKKDPKKADGAG